jgi:hypothetical protein
MGPEPQQDETPGQGEEDRIGTLDERFGKLEAEQATQRGILDRIETLVSGAKGTEGKAHGKAQQVTEDRLDAGPAPVSIAEQVRKAVLDVNAEQENKKRQDAHDADHQRMRELAERPPREPQGGWRGRLQSAMFGKEPS